MLQALRILWENHHGMLMAYIRCRKAHGLFVTVTIWSSGQSPPVDNVHDHYSYNGDDSKNCAEDITRPGRSRRLLCSGSVSCKQYQINQNKTRENNAQLPISWLRAILPCVWCEVTGRVICDKTHTAYFPSYCRHVVCHVQRVYFTSIRAKTHSFIFWGVLWPGYLSASRWNAFDWWWTMM